MSGHRMFSRREFSRESLAALFAGVSITVTGCGDGAPTSPSTGDRVGSVGSNHGHVATVTAMQLTSGNSVVLDIRGAADHPHLVELSAAEVSQVADGVRVSKNNFQSSIGLASSRWWLSYLTSDESGTELMAIPEGTAGRPRQAGGRRVGIACCALSSSAG